MPGPKELSKEKNALELKFDEIDDWIVAEHENPNQIQAQPQQVEENQPLNGAVYAQPEKIHENVLALNKYLESRKDKEWATTYDDYKILAEALTRKASLQNMKTKKSSWNKLELEAKAALDQVMAMDEEQQQIRKDANFHTLNPEIDALLSDRNIFTDSGLYRGILEAAEAYKEEKDIAKKMGCLAKLKTKMDAYASVRFKRSYSFPKGERRMGRVMKLLTMTNKLLQYSKIIETSIKENNTFAAVTADVKKHHLDDVKTIEAAGKYNVSDGRWYQCMLPYERDKKGDVTPETAANYAANLDFLEAFKSDDVVKQKVAICRLYQKMNLIEYDENIFTIEGILKEGESMFSGKGLHVNKNTMMDIIANFKDDPDPVFKYVMARVNDTCRSFMQQGAKNYLLSQGYNYQTTQMVSKDEANAFKTMEQYSLADAKRIFGGDVRADESPYVARNEEMEKALQKYIDDNTSPDSKVYLQKTADLFQENMKLQAEVNDSVRINHPEEYGSTKYWNQPNRQGNFMLPLEKDKNGELTDKGQQNYQYNEKMLKLLNSEDATDRIAALASCFLKCDWEGLSEDQLTESDFSRNIRRMLQTEGFYSKYNTLEDFLKSEFIRDKNNELVNYMRSIVFSARSQQATLLSQTYLNSQGYSTDGIGKKIKDVEKEMHRLSLEAHMVTAKEAFRAEREKNNGNLIVVDPVMTAKLEKLCKDKGLM